jgi:hypothetical protein
LIERGVLEFHPLLFKKNEDVFWTLPLVRLALTNQALLAGPRTRGSLLSIIQIEGAAQEVSAGRLQLLSSGRVVELLLRGTVEGNDGFRDRLTGIAEKALSVAARVVGDRVAIAN